MGKLIVIIGAGVVGLAIAERLSKENSCLLIERNPSFGMETSSRNSEVIHAGIYYPTDSLKAKLCVRGNSLMYKYLEENKLPFRRCGKYIIATKTNELEELNRLFELAKTNGVKGIRRANSEEIKRDMPTIKCAAALFSEDTGVVDTHSLMCSLEIKANENACDIVYSHEVIGISKKSNIYHISVADKDDNISSIDADIIINAAGLSSDTIAGLAGIDIDASDYRLKYCRGHYYRLPRKAPYDFNHLIYPVPPSQNGLLGIHITVDIANAIRLGPDIEYLEENKQSYHIPSETKQIFFDSVKSYCPDLDFEDLQEDTAGIRPRLAIAKDGFADFIIREESKKGLPNFINLIGIESPGLSSSLAIAEYIEESIL